MFVLLPVLVLEVIIQSEYEQSSDENSKKNVGYDPPSIIFKLTGEHNRICNHCVAMIHKRIDEIPFHTFPVKSPKTPSFQS